MSTKTIMQTFAAVMVVAIFVIVAAKFIVLPATILVSEKSVEIEELQGEVDVLSANLEDCKGTVLEEIHNNATKKLINYISYKTTVLSLEMINAAAHALTEAAKTNNVPLGLIVGIAEATSNFNTTYMSGKGHRGILALHPKHTKELNEIEQNPNLVDVGANVGAKTLKHSIKKHNGIILILDAYFVDTDFSNEYINDIVKASMDFNCYLYKGDS
jgi:hypothetical protein